MTKALNFRKHPLVLERVLFFPSSMPLATLTEKRLHLLEVEVEGERALVMSVAYLYVFVMGREDEDFGIPHEGVVTVVLPCLLERVIVSETKYLVCLNRAGTFQSSCGDAAQS